MTLSNTSQESGSCGHGRYTRSHHIRCGITALTSRTSETFGNLSHSYKIAFHSIQKTLMHFGRGTEWYRCGFEKFRYRSNAIAMGRRSSRRYKRVKTDARQGRRHIFIRMTTRD